MVVHTQYIHTGRLPPGLPLEVSYCALYINFVRLYQTIVALSANSSKQPPKCMLDVLCISTFHFYWGFASNKNKYVEREEKSFL